MERKFFQNDFDSLTQRKAFLMKLSYYKKGSYKKEILNFKFTQKVPPNKENSNLTLFLLLTPHESNHKNNYEDNAEKVN